VIFIKDTVFWGKLVSVGSLMVLAKDRTKWGDYWRILEKFGVKGLFHNFGFFDVGKHDHLGKTQKCNRIHLLKAPHLSVFPNDPRKSATDFSQPKIANRFSTRDMLPRRSSWRRSIRDDDRDDQARYLFLYINLLRWSCRYVGIDQCYITLY
jgi:hypothetical protein